MGNRVYAQLRLAPWNEGTLGEADAGRALLDAIDDYGFFEKNVEEDCGVPVGVFTDPEASWGTAAFLASLPRLKSWDSRPLILRPVGFALHRVPYVGMSLHARDSAADRTPVWNAPAPAVCAI